MKTSTIICLAVVLSLIAVPAMADLYTVDFVGFFTVKSHAGITLTQWGEYESGGAGHAAGGYGGIGAGNAAMVLGNTNSGDATTYAEITYPVKITAVTVLSHLDGIVDDSYSVTVDGADWGSYLDATTTETWLVGSYSGTPGYKLKIQITNPDWAWAQTSGNWGQLAIDKVEAVPVPAAVLLGMLGLSVAGVKLRKFA